MADSDMGMGAAAGAGQGWKSGSDSGGPVAGAVTAVIGGLAGAGLGAKVGQAKARYNNILNQYMGQMSAIDLPRYEDLKLALQRYARGEELTVDQLQALQDVDSEVQKLEQDKKAKENQLEALAMMKVRARGGLTLQDKADLLNAQKEIDRSSIGVQKSIMQNMAARGQSGSGAELAARMQGAQNATSQASQNALNVAARAQAGAMQSTKDAAGLSRQIGQDQLDFDMLKAKAADETRRSNLERLQDSMKYNIGTGNAAKAANWQRANQIGDKNVDLGNAEQQYNKNLLVDDYDRQQQRLRDIYSPQLGHAQAKIKDTQSQMAGILGSIGNMGNMMSFAGSEKNPNEKKQQQNPYGISNKDEEDEDEFQMSGGSYYDPRGMS